MVFLYGHFFVSSQRAILAFLGTWIWLQENSFWRHPHTSKHSIYITIFFFFQNWKRSFWKPWNVLKHKLARASTTLLELFSILFKTWVIMFAKCFILFCHCNHSDISAMTYSIRKCGRQKSPEKSANKKITWTILLNIILPPMVKEQNSYSILS